MGIQRIAAVTYAGLTVDIVVFQIAMAAGMPWGAYALFGCSSKQTTPGKLNRWLVWKGNV
ncbi:MAG: hypothetical protein FDX30_07270 [Chlorobium sp.]|nr:MAG: hypothetical protein FDX30_07270 [Chlorobium sp.]